MVRLAQITLVAALSANLLSTLSVYPHQLAYFNELSGGPENGPAHLRHSSVNWGQDLLSVREWMASNGIRDDEVYISTGWPRHIETLIPGAQRISDDKVSWVIVPAGTGFHNIPWGDRAVNDGATQIGGATFAFPRDTFEAMRNRLADSDSQ